MPEKTRLLWIAPKFPLGSPDGARLATCSLVRSLAAGGADVRLVCLVPDGETADAGAAVRTLGVAGCSIVRRGASRLFPAGPRGTPFTFRAFAAPRVRRALREEIARLLDGEPPFVVFDGLHAFAALEETDLSELATRCRGVVYRAHNHETSLWEQCADRSRWPWSRGLFRWQASLVRRFEARIARSVDLVAPVSPEDGRRFEAMAAGAPVVPIPIGMDFPPEAFAPPPDSATFELLFIGRMDWLPNRAGLLWFLENVWPVLIARRRRARLTIAGSGDGRWVKKYLVFPGVRFLGTVASVRPLYESCALSIAPIFQGSGTRVKIIESARHARPVLTTALGAEGLGLSPGSSYYRAEERAEWLKLLESLTLDECRAAGRNAFMELRGRFEEGAVAGRFAGALEAVRRQN